MNVENLPIIGKGGFGTVYYCPQRNLAIKVSYKTMTCRGWSNEKRKIDYIRERVPDLPNVHIIQVYNFYEDDKCFMEMEYIPPLIGNITTHIVFAQQAKDYDIIHVGRGRYLGYETLMKLHILTYNEIKLLLAQMSQMIAYIHYGAHFDGADLEYIIAPNKNIYIIDFDLSGTIDSWTKVTSVHLAFSLMAENYYPFPSDLLYPIFKENYLQVGSCLGFESISNQVMNYIEEEFKN